jgi:hypothetical protein
MSDLSATMGTFSDFKIIRGRKVAQVIVEIPLEQADEALRKLGGIPNPAEERWIGLALLTLGVRPSVQQLESSRLEPKQLPAPKKWGDLPLSQQAAIRCNEPDFQQFLAEHRTLGEEWGRAAREFDLESDAAASVVRYVCQVPSRAEITTNQLAAKRWRQLDDEFFRWSRLTPKKWDDLPPSQQAAIRCGEPDFQDFADAANAEEAREYICRVCQIQSRKELDTNPRAAMLWREIEDDYYVVRLGGRR